MGRRLVIFYGLDFGICEYMVYKFVFDVVRYGYDVFINFFDLVKDDLFKDIFVVILIVLYEGQFLYNVIKFVKWIEGLEGSELVGVLYSVWGCGKYFF